MPRSIGNLVSNWSNSSIVYTGIGMNMNAASGYHANSALLDLKLNSNSLIRLTSNGVLYVNGFPIGTNANANVGPAFDKANNANVIAVLAYDAANAAGGPTVGLAFNKANSANLLAFGVSTGANAYMLATVAGANDAVGAGANSVGSAAFAKANAALPNTSGVSFGGNLKVTGNLMIGDASSSDALFVYRPSTQQYTRASVYTANTMYLVGSSDFIAWANNGSHYTQVGHYSGGYGFLIFHANLFGYIATTTMKPLYFATNGITRLTIDENGFVGIYTSTPTANLHVVGNTTITSSLTVATINVVPAIAAAYDTANAASGTVGSEAFNKANSANIIAESAFIQANNALAAAVALAIALG